MSGGSFGLLSEFKVLRQQAGQLQQSDSGRQICVLSIIRAKRVWIFFFFIRMIVEHLSREKAWVQY